MYELTEDFIKVIISEVEMSQNIDRKKREYISEQIYDGNLWFYVKNRIKDWYPKTYENYSISDYSLLKKIVDKKAKAYREPPIRKLDTEAETEFYQGILKEGRFNDAMKRIDKLFNQHKYCALGIFKEPSEEPNEEAHYKFIPLAPYTFDVIKDEEGCPQVFIISYPDEFVTDGPYKDLYNPIIAEQGNQDENSYILSLWTEKEHKLIRVRKTKVKGESSISFELVPIDNNPDGINPWGVLPFVFIPHDIDSNYPNPSPLPGQTVEVNALNSVYLTSGNMQIGQLILKYPAGQEIQTVNQGLMSAIKLPQSTEEGAPETDADYISPSPNLDGHRTSIMTFLNMILDEQGIAVGQVVTGQADKYSSGFDRALANADVQSIIEENQDLYTRIENEVYSIIQAIESSTNMQALRSDSLQIVFKKPKMLISDTEKLSNLKQMMELGLLEDFEKFMIIDPNLTEGQAKEKAARINKSRKDLVSQLALNANK